MKYTTTAIALIVSASASAQWTVVNLHPAGAEQSYAHGVHDGQQVGSAVFAGNQRASLWSGTAGSWLDLTPSHFGAYFSQAFGVHSGLQVGSSNVSGFRASFWLSSAASWTDLHPVGASASVANGADVGRQVGEATFGGFRHAMLWFGSAFARNDLHPAGAFESTAYGVQGGQQVGRTMTSSYHASLWTGTAGSWIDLNPAGATESAAYGVDGGQQVGYAAVGTGAWRASIWSGTASSWVDMHPAGASSSAAFGVEGGEQVGYAAVDGILHASLWYGTAGSWVDLHAFLPPEFTVHTRARDISHDGGLTYVVGYGVNSTTNRTEALLWISRAIAPASFTTVRGLVTGGNLASLQDSDDNRLVVRPGIVFTSGEAPVQIRADATAPAAFPDGIAFSVESSATFGNAQQKVWLWNYVIGDYELVDTRLATLSDDVTNVIVRTNASRFIQPGTLAIRALVSYKAIGPAFAYPWSARIDKAWWTFPG